MTWAMAESVSRRLNEYLRNGQAGEGTGQSHQGFDNSQDGISVGKTPERDAQRYRTRDRISSVTR